MSGHHMTAETSIARHMIAMSRKPVCAIVLTLAVLSSWAGPSAAGPRCDSVPPQHTLQATQPLNIGELKLQALHYACSGQYDAELAEVASQAQAYVEMRAGQVAKPALVLDIDETSLSNWQEIHANDFGFIYGGACDQLPSGPCGVHAWELSARAEAIAPTLALFNAAKAKGVAIFFITGRADDEQTETAKNLRGAGYDGWADLIMRNASERRLTAKEYKTARRAKIAEGGYTIIANMGDQWSDLDGGYSERAFKLPNPFYFLP